MRGLPVCFFGLIVAAAVAACAQNCPKVTYTTPAATTKSLVAAVNCLIAASEPVKGAAGAKSALSVDSFQIVGPQHTRSYRHVVFAVLIVPVASTTKAVAVTPESPESSVTGTGGGECKIKINSDNTVDGQCNLTGGTMYIVFK